MKLARFRVQNYKIVDDTDWVKADEFVTALLGKNESGKTAILRALWKTRNVSSSATAKFEKLRDFPLDRYTAERDGTQEVTALEFTLSDQEGEALAGVFGVELKSHPKRVWYHTSYEGKSKIAHRVAFEDRIEKLCARPASLAVSAAQRLLESIEAEAAGSAEAVRKAFDASAKQLGTQSHLWDASAKSAIEAFDTAAKHWTAADASRATVATRQREEFTALLELARQGDPSAKARKWVEDNLPAFIYFDDYGQLETRIHLPTYLRKVASPDERTRTQSALFEKTKLNPQEILNLGRVRDGNETDEQVQQRKEERRILLESASFSLSGNWMDWWPEKQHQLHFIADGEDLVLLVADEHNRFRIPFEERSQGFQWFFSFYLVFLVESAKAHKGAILLLDEPGLHLHPTLQAKLIHLFELMSKENQLLYSTHLPFLVDGDHLERVRTVYRAASTPRKTTVSNDVRPQGDRDTLFPLQAAVGYSIAQTLFIGKRSVIVEGITDYWLLKTLDACLRVLGHAESLHPDTVLVPAGGTRRMMPLASIMFADSGVGGRRMLVMLDSDAEGVEAGKRFERELFTDDTSRVLHIGEALGSGSFTIEDLVDRDEYVAALKQTGRSFTLDATEEKAATTVDAMTKLFARKKWGEFGLDDKAKTVLQLVDQWGKNPKSVSGATIKRAADLIAAINRRFSDKPEGGKAS